MLFCFPVVTTVIFSAVTDLQLSSDCSHEQSISAYVFRLTVFPTVMFDQQSETLNPVHLAPATVPQSKLQRTQNYREHITLTYTLMTCREKNTHKDRWVFHYFLLFPEFVLDEHIKGRHLQCCPQHTKKSHCYRCVSCMWVSLCSC